jgi:hypothetical protein
MCAVPVRAIIASGEGFSKFIIFVVGIRRCYDGWERIFTAETQRRREKRKINATPEGAEVAEDAEA